MAEASRRASTNSSQTHLMSSMSRNSPSGSSQNMRVGVWRCYADELEIPSNPRSVGGVPPCTLPCRVVAGAGGDDAGRSGQRGRFRRRSGARDRSGASRSRRGPRRMASEGRLAMRVACPTANGGAGKAPIFLAAWLKKDSTGASRDGGRRTTAPPASSASAPCCHMCSTRSMTATS